VGAELRILALAALCAAAAAADTLYLTPAGVAAKAELAAKIAPAPVYTDWNGKPYLVGIVREAHPARDLKSEEASEATHPRYLVVACDTQGQRVSATVELSGLHVEIRESQLDSLLDLRTFASNHDRLLETEVGSRAYLAALLQRLDPSGELGLSRGEAPEPPAGLVEGALLLHLRRPAGGDALPPGGREALDAATRERRPLITVPAAFGPPGPALGFAQAIARARRYPVHEPSFERAALALLTLRTNLILAKPEVSPYAKRVHEHGLEALRSLIGAIGNAHPRERTPEIPPLPPVEEWLEGVDDPERREAIRERWEHHREAREKARAALKAAEALSGLPNREALPTHEAEVADAALDALLQSEGLYALPAELRETLVHACTRIDDEAPGPSTQDDAPLDLRAKAIRLLARVAGPRRARSPEAQARRSAAAASYREQLLGLLIPRVPRARQRIAFAALDRVGWTDDEATRRLVQHALDEASRLQRRCRRHGFPADSPAGTALSNALLLARDLSTLAYRDTPEAALGRRVLDWVEDLEARRADDEDAAALLAAWERVQAAPPGR